jgi:hypothetical protein
MENSFREPDGLQGHVGAHTIFRDPATPFALRDRVDPPDASTVSRVVTLRSPEQGVPDAVTFPP